MKPNHNLTPVVPTLTLRPPNGLSHPHAIGSTKEAKLRELRDEMMQLMCKQQLTRALRVVRELEGLDPDEPRWPHTQGDILCRMQATGPAAAAYERATQRYFARGLVKRASAMANKVLQLDATRLDVLSVVSPAEAERLGALYSGQSASLRPRTHPMVVPIRFES